VFHYISGKERGRRAHILVEVKGQTENELMELVEAILEAGVYRCAAVGKLAESVCGAVACVPVVEAVPFALCGW